MKQFAVSILFRISGFLSDRHDLHGCIVTANSEGQALFKAIDLCRANGAKGDVFLKTIIPID